MQKFLGSLYCLTVVVLPYMHLMFDAHGADAASSACSGHAHEQEHHPEGNTPDAHHESCLLCKFLTAANETPERAPDLQATLRMIYTRGSVAESHAFSLTCTTRARAPPYMTA